LAWKVIRMVSEQNMLDDPLRMLRIYRFAQTLSFTPDIATIRCAGKHGALLERAAVERITEELSQILATRDSYRAMKMMDRDGFLDHLFPELCGLPREQLTRQLQSYGYFEHVLNNLPLYFFDHAARIEHHFSRQWRAQSLKFSLLFPSLDSAETAAWRLKFSQRKIEGIARVAFYVDRFSRLMEADEKEQLRLLHAIGDTIYELVAYLICRHCICQLNENPLLLYSRDMLGLYHGLYTRSKALIPLINGDDLIRELGLAPSPLFGRLLSEIEMLTVDGSITTSAEALAAAREIAR
ncbi:MAG TPA: hypothetical protein VK445_03330, partial [Dissulfurispiraceae bacterium]|nr:hypothetical protein [Dissulfurispiraceae bacterium]